MKKKVISLFDYTGAMVDEWVAAGYECWIFDGQHAPGINPEPENENGGQLIKVGMWFDASKMLSQALQVANMVIDTISTGEVHMVFSFAECTYLTTTGARWFYHPDDKHLPVKDRRPHPLYPDRAQKREEAVTLAKMARMVASFSESFTNYDIPWMLENPAVSFLNTKWRRPDHTFNPCDYGGYLPEGEPNAFYPDVYPPQDAYNKNTGIWCGNGFVMPLRAAVEPVGPSFPGFSKAGGKSTKTKNIRSVTPRGFAKAVFEANHGRKTKI